MPSQNIDIHIQLDVSSPPEPTGPMDYATLGALCVVTVLEIVLCIYIRVRNGTYAPLRSNLNNLLYMMVACGLINSWGSFVAAKQLDAIEPIRTGSCVTWHFWIEYFIGMNGVFVTLMLRVLLRAYSFHEKIKMMNIQAKKILRNWLVLVVIAPLLIVCTYATVFESSYYDPQFETCVTVIYVKGLLMLWVFISGLGIFVSGTILENGIKGDNLSERIQIKRCLVVAAVVGVACAVINTSGLMRYSIGRSLFTMLLLSVHLFMFTSLVGYKVYKALKNDDGYAFEFLNSKAVHDICFKSLYELKHTPYVFTDFLMYCQDMQPIEKGDRIIDPTNLLACHEAIQSWKDFKGVRDEYINPEISIQTESIIKVYVKPNATSRVCSDDNIYNNILLGKKLFPPNLFDDLDDHVLQQLFDAWGSGYISQWNSKSVLNAYVFENFAPPPIPSGFKGDDEQPPPDPKFTDMVDDQSNSSALRDQLAWLKERTDKIESSKRVVKRGDRSVIDDRIELDNMSRNGSNLDLLDDVG